MSSFRLARLTSTWRLYTAPTLNFLSHQLSTTSVPPSTRPQRALLYVPASDHKKLKKSFESPADVIIFDLEDSVAVHQKGGARSAVYDALQASHKGSGGRKFVRINSFPMGRDDLEVVLKSHHLEGIVIPKVNSAQDVIAVDQIIDEHGLESTKDKLVIVASIESPLALVNIKEIATSSKRLDSLLFAAEDYCASSNIIRTKNGQEMLYARSTIVTYARAFGLRSIDLVCTAFRDFDELRSESQEGRELGFDGKQAIHPAQVEVIQNMFVPSEKEIKRAVAILAEYEKAAKLGHGAYGLTDESCTSMIDAPMLLQAQSTLAQARAAGLVIPGSL